MIQDESLNVEIILSGTFWEKRPQFSVWFDDHVIVQTEIANASPQTVSFNKTVSSGEHSLKIRLENKTKHDTVVDGSVMLKDMLLNINNIIINKVSLDRLIRDSEYILDQPQLYQGNTIIKLKQCVNLGWNGTYVFKFSCPFYQWLLKKL